MVTKESPLWRMKQLFGYDTCSGMYATVWGRVMPDSLIIGHKSAKLNKQGCNVAFQSTETTFSLNISDVEVEDAVFVESTKDGVGSFMLYILSKETLYKSYIVFDRNDGLSMGPLEKVLDAEGNVLKISAILENFLFGVIYETTSGRIGYYPPLSTSKMPVNVESKCYVDEDSPMFVYITSGIPYISHGGICCVSMVVPYSGNVCVIPGDVAISICSDKKIRLYPS